MLERRNHRGDCEIRSVGGKSIIAGYAAVFDAWSQDLGGFIERIDPKAFTRTLRQADVRALANHDPNWLLGRSKNGTLSLGTDSGGLYYEIEVNPNDPDGQRALQKVERGDWDGSSFGFRVIDQDWDFSGSPAQRTLLEVELRDVGPVTFPAYLDTSSQARSAIETYARDVPQEAVDAFLAGDLVEVRAILLPAPAADTGAENAPQIAPVEEIRTGEIERIRIKMAHRVGARTIEDPSAIDEAKFALEEVRAGKTLSAASIAAIQQAIESLEALVATAVGEPEPEENQEGRADNAPQDLGSILDQMNLLGQQFIDSTTDNADANISMQEILESLNRISQEALTSTGA